jgi:hypothetical protein
MALKELRMMRNVTTASSAQFTGACASSTSTVWMPPVKHGTLMGVALIASMNIAAMELCSMYSENSAIQSKPVVVMIMETVAMPAQLIETAICSLRLAAGQVSTRSVTGAVDFAVEMGTVMLAKIVIRDPFARMEAAAVRDSRPPVQTTNPVCQQTLRIAQ